MEQIRTFIAIELDGPIKKELIETQALLRNRGITDQVRWARPEGIHLTLKFLGDVAADRVPEIVVAIRQASEGIGSFPLGFGGVGCFPSVKRPNVIWIGVLGDSKTLAHLQRRVEERLAVLGFPAESRKYIPHLTLGRVHRRTGNRQRSRLGELIQRESIDPLGEMTVREVSLMKSVLSPAGARHSRLAAVGLEGR